MPSRYTKGSCIEHQCMHESCSTTTKNIGSCCQKHSCSIFGCNKKRDNTTFFCVDHKCVHSGCTYGILCNETHICSFPACEVIVYGKIINCLHHTCHIKDCSDQALVKYGMCCIHACVIGGCVYKHEIDSIYCSDDLVLMNKISQQ